MSGLTEQDRAWADAIAALPRRGAGGTGAAAEADMTSVVLDALHAAHHKPGSITMLDLAAHVATAVLDALGTGAGQAAADALDEVERRLAETAGVEASCRKVVRDYRRELAAVTSADDATPSDQGGNEAGEGVGG